jgi:hypothetical protein
MLLTPPVESVVVRLLQPAEVVWSLLPVLGQPKRASRRDEEPVAGLVYFFPAVTDFPVFCSNSAADTRR